MTVQELINELTDACEGRDLSTIEVKKVVQTRDGFFGFSEDWEDPYIDTAGGNDYPFVVLVK